MAFRADGGPGSGLGHVRRCLALAAALSPSARALFVVHGSDTVAALVHRAGIECRLVGRTAGDLARALDGVDAAALVLDAYSLDPAAVAAATHRLLVVVDDSGRFPVPGDVVVSAALGLRAPDRTAARYLLGPSFALLPPAFAEAPRRSWNPTVRRVLLTLGGGATAGATASLAAAVLAAIPGAVLDVVAGPVGDSADAVEAALGGGPDVVIHRAPEDLRPLMLGADLAVSGGGVTLLELAATATPAVAVSVAANQEGNLHGLARLDAVRYAGPVEDADAVGAAARALAGDPSRRRALGERARHMVDGGGAARVAAAVRDALAAHAVGGRAAC